MSHSAPKTVRIGLLGCGIVGSAFARLLDERAAAIASRTGLALEVSALRGRRLAAVVGRRDRYERLLRRVLREGIARGAFRAVDPKLTAFSIFGSINWIARWYRPRGGAGAAEIGRAFADLYLRALRSDPDSLPADRPAPGRRP